MNTQAVQTVFSFWQDVSSLYASVLLAKIARGISPNKALFEIAVHLPLNRRGTEKHLQDIAAQARLLKLVRDYIPQHLTSDPTTTIVPFPGPMQRPDDEMYASLLRAIQ